MSWDPPQPPGLRAQVQQPPLNPGIYSLENHGRNGISWLPTEQPPFHYVEAYQYDNMSTCAQDLDLRQGLLHERDAEDWLQSRVDTPPTSVHIEEAMADARVPSTNPWIHTMITTGAKL
jgi:hypothetical protein